jgi:uncharacterized protein (TIGR00299 family) protein
MLTAYFDCFAGVAGDMFVASLLDAGADFDHLQSSLARLDLPKTGVRWEKVHKSHIVGTRFIVEPPEGEQPHRHLHHLLELIDAANLTPHATKMAHAVFHRLGEAEARVHGMPIEKVHFHEVGAIDSIIDIVGACIALDQMGVTRIVSSAMPLGSGTVQCDHGTLPVPAPATVQLMQNFPVTPGLAPGELTTPTGAALLTALAETFGAIPEMRINAVGYGAGTRELDGVPNLLRVFIGKEHSDSDADTVVELQANVDDSTGELLGATVEALLHAGALDAWLSPIIMKHGRPAWTLHALCGLDDVTDIERVFFAETTTFGVRQQTLSRTRLRRSHEQVVTPFGPVRIKLGYRGETLLNASPEFADAQAAAASHSVSVRVVMDAARRAWDTVQGQ